jgi:hypothetical protein
MIILASAVFYLVELTGPNNQPIDINPATVVSIRERRAGETHLQKGVRCVIHTSDGKFIAVLEDCDTVRRKLEGK